MPTGLTPSTITYTVTPASGTVPVPNGGSTSWNPYPLSGTEITETSTDALALSARVHRKATDQSNLVELYYYRDSAWNLFPFGPLTDDAHAPTLTWTYRLPSTLEFTCYNPQGELTPENMNSSYNTNVAGGYDPLFDEARKVLLRVGCRCFNNLAAGIVPSAGVLPSTGTIHQLTDGILQDYTTGPTQTVVWSGSSISGSLDIEIDLGTAALVRHVVARCGSLLGHYYLPQSVQVLTSTDNTNWTAFLPRPVGGTGGGSVPPGDWYDDPNGRGIEAAVCDLDTWARYVIVRVTPDSGNDFAIDEIAVYGGDNNQILGRNMFVGYLGDDISIPNDGTIRAVATDSMKRASDNNETPLTAPFFNAELGDIAFALLTGTIYWTDENSYSAPFTSEEIGWQLGDSLTGLIFPVWQNQTNNMLGYLMDLFHSVGWVFLSDGNGVWQAFEPPYQQVLPDRVFSNADDGLRDVRKIVRTRTGKDMRNIAWVRCGKTTDGASGTNMKPEPNSVARYGPRRVVVTDPLLETDQLRDKTASYILRDYAFRLSALKAEIQPDFDTRIKAIHGIRADWRPQVFARGSSVSGWLRNRELWSLTALTQKFCVSDWAGQANYVPYFPTVIDPPIITALLAPTGTGYLTVDYSPQTIWNAFTQPASYNLYVSTTSESGPWTLQGHPTVSLSAASVNITGVSSGLTYWAYMTSVDGEGNESLPSEIVSTVADSGVTDNLSGWTVTDFAASLSQSSGPDSQGFYTYAFYCTWTSPSPKGYKRMTIRMSYNSLPTVNTTWWSSWPLQNGTWNEGNAGHIVPPGLTWDRVSAGQLDWECRFRTQTPLTSGSHMYLRMWTSSTNIGFSPGTPGGHYSGYPSNIATVNL